MGGIQLRLRAVHDVGERISHRARHSPDIVPDFTRYDAVVRGLRFLGSLTRPILTVLLIVLTCGIYGIYLLVKGKKQPS